MPPLDPNQFPPPYLNPNEPEQLRLDLDAPAFNQQAIDVTAILKENLNALSSLSAQIANNLGDVNEILNRQVGNLDRVGKGYDRINRSSQASHKNNLRMAEVDEKREKTLKNIRDAEEKGINALRQQFRLGEMINKQGNLRFAKDGKIQEISPQEYMEMPDAQRQGIREQLAGRLGGKDPRFKLSEALGSLAKGDIAGVMGEAFQTLPLFGKISESLMSRGERLSSRAGQLKSAAKEPGAEFAGDISHAARVGMRAEAGLTSGLSSLVGRGLPMLFTPAAVYGLQRELRQGIRTYQNDLRQGMAGGLTGGAAVTESVRAGLRARLEGINPFDALTTQMAQEIARGIQSEGFTGTVRAAWQDSVTDTIKHTGMDAGQALQLMSTAANQLGENANQFRGDMALVETTAKQTSVSVNQAATAMQALQQAFFLRGGEPGNVQAAALSTTLTRALPRSITTRGTLATAIAQNWQTIVARAGINPAQAYMPGVLSKSAQILDQIAAQLWQWKNRVPEWRNMKLQDWVTYMEGMNPGFFDALLPGATNADIVAFMNRSKGGGFQKTRDATVADEAKSRTRTVHEHHSLFSRFGRAVAGGLLKGDAAAATAADFLTGHHTDFDTHEKELVRNFQNSDIDLKRTRRNLIASFSNQLDDLTPAQRRQVLAPLREAGSYEELVGTASERAQTIYIKMHPTASHWFNAEPANVQRYYDSARGRSNSQGLVRPSR